jgi:hypothetical protein
MALMTMCEIAELNICLIRLTRIGNAEGEIVETQHRVTVPAVGEVIEVALDGIMTVRARVTHISSPLPGAEKCFTIAVDELSSGYLLETLSALAQCADGEPSSGASLMEPASAKPHSALEATLKLARQCHTLTRRALDQPKPDMAAALRYMKAARRAGCLAAPHLKDEQLRRRIVGYKPMSEEEWGLLWPGSLPDCK